MYVPMRNRNLPTTTIRKSNDVFHRISESAFRSIIAESTSVRQVFIKMGLCIAGDQYKPFRRRVEELSIDLSHFRGSYRKGETFKTELPIEMVFIEGTHHNGRTLSHKIRKHNLKPYCCVKCGNTGEWRGEPLSLQIDHINGMNTDNRLENLRYLCPNCHTQTDTFAGKRKRIHRHCSQCGKPCTKEATRCRKCSNKISRPQVSWPTLDVIAKDVWNRPPSILALEWGGTANSLKKHCRKHGIALPPRSYWIRRRCGYTHDQSLVSQARVKPKQRIISEDQIIQAISLRGEGKSNRDIGVVFGFHHTSIGRAISRYQSDGAPAGY